MTRLLLAILALLALAGCEKHSAPPTSSGERVAVLSPAAAVTLKELGLERFVVARHAFDLALDTSLPVCGDQAGIDYERLVACAPTRVVIQWGSRELPDRLRELAADHRWTLIRYDPLTLPQAADATSALVREFGPLVEPRCAAAVEQRFHDLLAMAPKDPSRRRRVGRVLLLASTQPLYALGPGSWHQDVLERLGATPAIEQGQPYIRLDPEDLAARAPEGIVLVIPRAPRAAEPPRRLRATDFDPADLRERLGKAMDLHVPAIERGHVALIDDPYVLTPSTAILDFADRLREVLDAWEHDTP